MTGSRRARAMRGVGLMNLYTMLGNGTHEAASLGARLTAWHDAMVAHERKIRTGRIAEVCDEECPHAEARTLWTEALEVFGNRAHELTFLRSRATATSERSKQPVASTVRSAARLVSRLVSEAATTDAR
jgi:hypothetical protein